MPEPISLPPKRSPLDDIAPYPRTEEQATASALIKHYAAFGEMHSHLSQALTDGDRCRQSVGHVVSSYGLVFLLGALRARIGEKNADDIARELWEDMEGGALPPILWDYVGCEGLDHDAIEAAANEVERNIRAKDKAAALPAGEKS